MLGQIVSAVMTAEEIKSTVIGVVSALGGTAGIIAIIRLLYSIYADYKNRKVTKANTKALTENKEASVQYLKENMVTSIKVDVSAQLRPLLDEMREQFIDGQLTVAQQLDALKGICILMGRILVKTPKLTADERNEFSATIDMLEQVIPNEQPKENTSGILVVALDEPKKETVDEESKPTQLMQV